MQHLFFQIENMVSYKNIVVSHSIVLHCNLIKYSEYDCIEFTVKILCKHGLEVQ